MPNVDEYINSLNYLTEAERLKVFKILIERYPEITANYIAGIDNLTDVERLKIFSTLITRPEIKEMLNRIINPQNQTTQQNTDNVPIVNFGTSADQFDTSGNGLGGQRKSLAIPGRANMIDNIPNGFSTYLLLAILAFTIQFLMVLICIFFYK